MNVVLNLFTVNSKARGLWWTKSGMRNHKKKEEEKLKNFTYNFLQKSKIVWHSIYAERRNCILEFEYVKVVAMNEIAHKFTLKIKLV